MSGKPRITPPAGLSDSSDGGPGPDIARLKNEIESLRARVAEQAREISRLDELAETDPLTGIGNRRSFEKEIHRRVAEQQRDGRGFCLMVIDVDGFKQINDQFGHAEGDRLLQMIAGVVNENIRASDIVYRIGGDEFSILLPGSTLTSARHAARRLVDQTVSMIQSRMGNVPVGLSIGLVEYKEDDDVDSLIRVADNAMYRAKKQGGNRFEADH